MPSFSTSRSSVELWSGDKWLPSALRPSSTSPAPPRPSTEPPRPSSERLSLSLRRPATIVAGLCKDCSTIDFGQFAPSASSKVNSTTNTSTALLPLENIIKNQQERACKFCNLLFDSISLPMHDPFEHPAIKDHMPPDIRGKTFETWATGLTWQNKVLRSPHPFGRSRNKIRLKQNASDPDAAVQEIRSRDLEAAEQAGIIVTAGTTGAGVQAVIGEKGKSTGSILKALGSAGSLLAKTLATMDRQLPAVVTIKMHVTDDDAGLLNVSLLGYGNKVQAPLSVVSSFNLRVASNYKEVNMRDLHYGRILGQLVNVEADCHRWLTHCHQRHGGLCGSPDWSKKLPLPSGENFRLIKIDMDHDDVFRIIRVVDEGKLPEYAALSYVWGDAGARAVNLHLQNVAQLSHRIPPESVARTIRDAIKVTKRLGIRYLWVDSLCVIQKPQSGDDEPLARQTQLDQMGSIYGHACVAIVAAGGEDAAAGLAGVSFPRMPGQLAEEVKPTVNVLLPVQYDCSYGKWDTRAWTLQEKLLSKRMLVFGENHVSFHCRHGVLREDMPAVHAANGPPPIPHLSMPEDPCAAIVKKSWDGTPVILRSPFFDEYAKLMGQYTSRDRSNSGDILKAILGLLGVLESMRRSETPSPLRNVLGLRKDAQRDHTLHGLPEEFLDLALLWQPPAVQGTHLTMRANDMFPSWSWAGWEVSKSGFQRQGAGGSPQQAHPGVRFEEPFWVSAHDDLSLRKFEATGNEAEERFRPLIMWYKVCGKQPRPRTPALPPRPGAKKPPPGPKPSHLRTAAQCPGELVLVNSDGMGIVCGSPEVKYQWEQEVTRRFGKPQGNPVLSEIQHDTPLDSRHLVCKTQVNAFRLRQREKIPRKETIWKRVGEEVVAAKELEILEAEIIDDYGRVVGYMIPTDQGKTVSTDLYDLMLLSESQYWGNEGRVDVSGFPLYNVMAVAWDTRCEFASRLGLGKIYKWAWDARKPTTRCVILK